MQKIQFLVIITLFSTFFSKVFSQCPYCMPPEGEPINQPVIEENEEGRIYPNTHGMVNFIIDDDEKKAEDRDYP